MPKIQVREGERAADIARRVLGDARLARELVGVTDPYRPLEAGTVLFLPGGPAPLDTPLGVSLHSQPGVLSDLPGPAQDQITNLVNLFDSLLGYPKGFNAIDFANMLAQQGLASRPEEAFAFMYSVIDPGMQAAFPWAQFGLDEQSYHQEAARYQSMWLDMTGASVMPTDLLKGAITGQWTIQQMMQEGQKAAHKGTIDAPWLATGQTYQQVQENFYSAFGHMPTNTDTLRAWFGFRSGAQQLQAGGEAQVGLTQQAQARMKDVEIR